MRLFLPAALVLFANWGNLALAQTPQSSLPPEVMNSTYQYGYPSKETVAIRLQGDSEKLKVDEKWSDGKVTSTLLRYKNITFIRIQAMPIYAKSEKNYFFVETLDKTVYLFPLRTEEEAKLVAAYVARQTGLVPPPVVLTRTGEQS